MVAEDLVLYVITTLLSVVGAFTVPYYFWWRQRDIENKSKIGTLTEENERLAAEIGKTKALQEEYEALKKASHGFEKLASLFKSIKTKRYDDLIHSTWDSLQQGIVKLTVRDYFTFWTQLHGENDIIFFRLTSRINPKLWDTDMMKLYQRRQMENVEAYYSKPPAQREKITETIENLFGEKIENNFERVFIYDEKQLTNSEIVNVLARTISEQVKHIDVKLLCIDSRERPLPTRPQDFGIVVTEKGDRLLMDLEVSPEGEAGGGRIVFDEDIINSYVDIYSQIDNVSKALSRKVEWGINKIKKEITSLKPVFIYEENRCLKCFVEAERMVSSGKWKKESYPKRMWYEILDAENQATKDIFVETRPHRILEIGCGPGRIIQQLLQASHEKGIPIERIIGFEQNPEIYAYAFHRFLPHINVYIQRQLFGDNGGSIPYDDDFFDLVIGVSNIVGWQKSEEQWIREAFRVSKNFFFTIYKHGLEDERRDMYQSLGCEATQLMNGNLQLTLVDAFGKKPHITKSYEKEDVENFLEKVLSENKGSTYEIFDVGKYMFGCLLRKGK